MKRQQFILLFLLGVLAISCSPRVDDLFEDTAIVRLEKRREALMEQFIQAENGWVMQYFARLDPTSSDTLQHRGYTFIMKFRNDGTVTVGAPVNGVYKTETSMWDVINDNSSVLTFNTFNSIFHYCSNPDPDLGLWGADGEGVGGDYEFQVLEYNQTENYQLLKGKKNGCYIRMYPMTAGVDWEDYFAQIDAANRLIFSEDTPLDLYKDDLHWTLYNGQKHEFRAFTYGEDTLGGGSYYGFLTTPSGIYVNGGDFALVVQHYEYDQYGNKINESVSDTTISFPRDLFTFSPEKTRLVSSTSSKMYITIDALNLFTSSTSIWRFGNAPSTTIAEAEERVNQSISAFVPNSRIASYGWKKAEDGRYELYVYYSLRGKAATNYDIYYFKAEEAGRHSLKLTYDAPHPTVSFLQKYGSLDLVPLLEGTYDFDLTQPFAPSKGVTATRRMSSVVLRMAH